MRQLYGESKHIYNSLSCIGTLLVVVSAYVVRAVEYECGGGGKECVVLPLCR